MTREKVELNRLPAICREWRRWILRMIHKAKSGHPGGSLSIVEIVAQLFLRQMRHDPLKPDWSERDRFVLSKGHGVPTLYVALAHTGYIEEDELLTLRQIDSRLEGHPDRCRVPGIEASTGSLGQGLSIGIGHALAGRLDKRDYRTFVLMGDGEIQEGQVWEAAMLAAHEGLSNLTAIIDVNGFQLDDATKAILDIHPIAEKWQAFGWAVREVDGHDVNALEDAFEWARRIEDKPTVLVCKTIKGKGVSFMEHNNEFHGSPPSDKDLATALEELRA
jgi:transketolase